jgi:hypothetical protein
MAMLVDTGDTETGQQVLARSGTSRPPSERDRRSWWPAWQPKEDGMTNRSISANHEKESA